MSARPEAREGTAAKNRGKALVLGGGGLLGAMYEIGCLAALERAVPGVMSGFDLYVGTSAGAVVASLLAAGHTASELLDSVESFSPGNLCRLDLNALLRASVRLPYRWVRGTLAGLFRRPSPVGLWLSSRMPSPPDC